MTIIIPPMSPFPGRGAAPEDYIAQADTTMQQLPGVIAKMNELGTAFNLGAGVLAGGYLPPVPYAAGIKITLALQTVQRGETTYAPLFERLPFVTESVFDATAWRVVQGVTAGELAEPGAAARIFYTPNLPNALTKSVQAAIESLQSRHTYNVNVDSFSVAQGANQSGSNTGKQIWLFFDSHGWGQGAPEWDNFSGATGWSSHSAKLGNMGFFGRLARYIEEKCAIDSRVYCMNGADGRRVLPDDALNAQAVAAGLDPIYAPIRVAAGNVIMYSQTGSEVIPGISSHRSWFTPEANNLGDDVSYKMDTYRDKLSLNRFPKPLAQILPETLANFTEIGKTEYVKLKPIPSLGISPGFTAVLDSAGNVLAEYDSTNFYIRLSENSPAASLGFFTAADQPLFIEGFGRFLYKNAIAVTGGRNLRVTNLDGTFPVGLHLHLQNGSRVYHAKYIDSTTLYIDPEKPFRRIYIAARRTSTSRDLRISLTTPITGGLNMLPHNRHSPVCPQTNQPLWMWDRTGYPIGGVVDVGGNELESADITVDDKGVVLHLRQGNETTPDLVFWIDYGVKAQTRVLIQDGGGAAGTVGSLLRGVIFDNSSVTNFSMGGHTIGQWMGDGPSFNDPARDHLADIISYAKSSPSLCITGLPLVNEYLGQTPIATFKANLNTFITRVNATRRPDSIKVTDFLFFTTLGGRDIEFEGAASAPISPDAYVAAAKEVILARGAGLVDCRQAYKDLVGQGVIDYRRLYSNNYHPSSFYNEGIYKMLVKAVDEIL